jgi:hypothetical protein
MYDEKTLYILFTLELGTSNNVTIPILAEKPEGTIKNGQYRDTDHTVHTTQDEDKHNTKTQHNTEKHKIMKTSKNHPMYI